VRFVAFRALLRARRIRESSSKESPVRHGTTLTCTDAVSVYSPMVVTAVIVPDLDTVRVQGLSNHWQSALIPPVPLSGRHVQGPDKFHATASVGVTVAVNVTDCAPVMLFGLAVTVSVGRSTVTCTESVRGYSPIVAVAFIHPDRPIVAVQVLLYHAQFPL